ncbi:hypothetical protein F4860DRAFT_38841 [Xylaria cubensis]|nr:hypothetical protein F4860DRAFT_38841 [Xylaria cubensis]
MFSLDPNMDFLFSSGTFSFPNPSEDMGVVQAAPPPPSEYQSVSGTQYPVTYSTISPTSPLGTSEFETGRSTTADSIGALSSPWPTLDRRTTQVTDHSLSEYCRTDADIDFRFNTSFGLAELPAPPRDSHKHLEICRILRNLTKSQSPTSNPKDGSVQSGPSLSKTTPEVTIQPCVKACFKSNAEIPMFLRTTDVVKRIFEVRESPHPDALSLLFSDAIIAMGLDGMRNPVDERRGSLADGSEQYRSILDAAVDFHAVPNSFLKLQTAVVLSIIASNKNDSRLSEILSIGVHCARELRFTNSNIIRKVFMQADDQKLAERTVWVLYCLETSFSVTRGIPPVRDVPQFENSSTNVPSLSSSIPTSSTIFLRRPTIWKRTTRLSYRLPQRRCLLGVLAAYMCGGYRRRRRRSCRPARPSWRDGATACRTTRSSSSRAKGFKASVETTTPA